jgi:hypothetical protein
VATIQQHFQRLPVPELPHWCSPSVRWYAGPDLLIHDEAQDLALGPQTDS